MDEFIKKVEDLYKRSVNRNIITYTGFLTPTEREIITKKFKNVKIRFCGGIEEAERVRAFFLPNYMEDIIIEEHITAFKAEFSFHKLSHRDFLGAILALGIERRCLGDIYVFDKEAYFFVTKEIASYIKLNLDKVGNIGIRLYEVEFDNVRVLEPEFKSINFTVQSIRIDSIVSGAIKESREKANFLIRTGNVLLNYLVCDNASKEMSKGDIFSVKGYGKFYLDEIGGESRRGKIFVKVNKYI